MPGQDQAPQLPALSFEKELTLSDADQLAFGKYPETVLAAREMARTMNALETFISTVNLVGGLPNGHMVMTETETRPTVSMEPEKSRDNSRAFGAPEHGSIIYRPNLDAQFSSAFYVPDGELVTWGAKRLFLGDRFQQTDGQLILINSELEVGITVHGMVKMVKTTEHEKDFLDDTMPLVEQVTGGARKLFPTGR